MSSKSHWDVIVLGLGGAGSAAIYHAASAGLSVLGIDQFSPAHDMGSSHGRTRVIRQAYFEDPIYVPMLHRSYALWQSLEQIVQRTLFVRTGLVEIGPGDGVVIPGVRRSAQQHGLPIEEIPIADVHARWPGLRANEQWQAVMETNAGYLLVESCVSAHLQAALQAGAVCRHDEPVQQWSIDNNQVVVQTRTARHVADRLIVAAGPWSAHVLDQIGLPLQVLRKHQYWLESPADGFDQHDHFPCFFFETPSGYFYGFPSINDSGVKVARHSGGEQVNGALLEEHPWDDDDFQLVSEFVTNHLPGVSRNCKSHVGCYYTMTPSEHFIIDRLPDHPQVIVIAGLSGHGFKFTTVLGEVAASLARDQGIGFDLERFRIATHLPRD